MKFIEYKLDLNNYCLFPTYWPYGNKSRDRSLTQVFVVIYDKNTYNHEIKGNYFQFLIDIRFDYSVATSSGKPTIVTIDFANNKMNQTFFFSNCDGGKKIICELINKFNIINRHITNDDIFCHCQDLRGKTIDKHYFDMSEVEPQRYNVNFVDLNFEDIDEIIYPNEYKKAYEG